jgi:GNAT superfamily N-acetyltransferase
MDEVLEAPSRAVLVRAMEANRCALWSLFARLPGAEVYDRPDALQVITKNPFPVFNTVHRAQFPTSDVDAAINAVVARARARGVRLMWFVGPSTRPADLAVSLNAHGLVHDEDVTGMAVDLSQLPDAAPLPPGLEITVANTQQDLRTWCSTMVAAFEMPETVVETYFQWLVSLTPEDRQLVQPYIGWLEDVPVATHLLILGGGAAGIHFLGTLPAGRGRGIGGAICLNTLREGRARGYRVGVTEAEAMAVGTCHRLGFKDYYTASVYIWRGEEASDTGAVTSRQSWTTAVTSVLRRPRNRGQSRRA